MTDFRIVELMNATDSYLVLGGIKWKTLIGTDKQKQSLRIAKEDKATHYLPADAYSHMVGTMRLPPEPKGRKKSKAKRRLYSAAAIFAQSHPTGAHVVKLPLDDGMFWIVAVHEAVIAKGTDVICTEQEAGELLATFLQAHAGAVTVSQISDARAHLNAHSELIQPKSAVERVPNSLKVAALLIIALLLVNAAWDAWQKHKRVAASLTHQAMAVDAKLEWEKALDKWARTIEMDGPAGLSELYVHMVSIPLEIDGWYLASAECAALPKAWSCSAKYKSGPATDNLRFKRSMPKNWAAIWSSLEYATGQWTIPAQRKAATNKNLISVADFSLGYISALQRVLPGFRTVKLDPPTPIVIAPPVYSPRNNGEMVKVQYPSDNRGIELPSTQGFEVKGPLRSFVVLPLTESTRIKSLRFEVEGRGVRPDIRTSVINGTLVGEIYVK